MKLIDALKNVDRSDDNVQWIDLDEVAHALNFYGHDLDWSEDSKLLSYPVANWYCTDSYVGIYALYLEDELVGYTYQAARKSDIEYHWLNHDAVTKVSDYIRSLNMLKEPPYSYLNPDEELGEGYSIGYRCQLLSDMTTATLKSSGETVTIDHERNRQYNIAHGPYTEMEWLYVILANGTKEFVDCSTLLFPYRVVQ